MMSKQPEALRLAAALHERHSGEGLLAYCEAELRRLHEANAELLEALIQMRGHVVELCSWSGTPLPIAAMNKARAAIAKATGANE